MADASFIDVQGLAAMLSARRAHGQPLVAGITGSVASGKSTLATALAEALSPAHRVELVSTDGFLFPNAELEARGLLLRKGYPETIDGKRLAHTLTSARTGAVEVPVYSHARYDVDPAMTRRVEPADIILVEGLGFAPHAGDQRALHALDTLLYIDAADADLEHWFLERFMGLWQAAEEDPASFYARFRDMTEAQARDFARTTVWQGINLPNLHQHISTARPHADILLWKERDHRLRLVRPGRPGG